MILQENKHIIVNYHYVEDPRGDFSGIYPCSVKDFERQIKFLSNNYKVGSISDVYNAAKNNSQEKYCAITFDDGLKDQYENAVPILKKYKANAIFFPITSTFFGKIPSTPKIHILLSNLSSEKLVDLTNDFLDKFYTELLAKFKIPKDKRVTEKRKLRDDILTANFKETINILPNNIEKHLMDWLFEKLDLDEKKLCNELFMSKDEILYIKNQGFEIGNHTHEHFALDFQNEEQIKEDLQKSNKLLQDLIGSKPNIFSYPHGGANNAAKKILSDENFKYAVTIERSNVTENTDQLLIPRYDTMDLKSYIESLISDQTS